MAEKQDFGGLAQASDMSKLPLYGVTEPQYEELKQAQEKALTALEQRYAQPNWFKVAAGFAKPQLGGFLASLGSASEAMGENVEQARAQQLPIAQMRAQLAQTNLLLSKNKEVSESIAEWQAQHPGQMPPADVIAKWQAYAPHSPTVKALADQQKFVQEQQSQALQILRGQFESGAITRAQYAEGLKLLQTQTQLGAPPPSKAAPAPAPAGTTEPAPAPASAPAPSSEVTPIKPEPVATPKEPKPGEKYAVIHRYPSTAELGDKPQEVVASVYKNAEERANVDESIAKAELMNYQPYMNPSLYNPYIQSLTKTQNFLAKHPQDAARVHDVLNKGDLLSQILSSIQKGGTISYGGLINGSASVSLPAETWVRAGLPRNLTSYANDLATEYMKQAALEARFGNASINKVPVAEFQAIMSAHPNLNQQWDSALHNTKQKLLDAWYQKKLGDTMINDKKNVDRDELAPYFSVRQNSKRYRDLQEAWNKETNLLQAEREKQLFPR